MSDQLHTPPLKNNEIETLVSKYSTVTSSSKSKSKRRTSSRSNSANPLFNASTPNLSYNYNNDESSRENSTRDLMMSASSSNVFARTSGSSNADSALQYVSGRRSSRLSKEERKQRRSSRRHSSRSRSPVSILMDEESKADTITPTTERAKTTSSSTRASVSESFMSTPDWSTSPYADKYILRPQKSSYDEEEELSNAFLPNNTNNNNMLMSQDADPNDPLACLEPFQDEFEDELDEIDVGKARQANFVNLGQMEADATSAYENRHRRRRAFLYIAVCCLILIGVVLGIVFGLDVAGKQKENAAHARPQVVPAAPSTLRLLCAEALDLGPGQAAVYPLKVPKDCEIACLKAECCWNPNSIFECTEETHSQCSAYRSPCSIMLPSNTQYQHGNNNNNNNGDATTTAPQVEVDVPQAPATLKTTCVPVGDVASVTQPCRDVCALGDCCWNTTTTMKCTSTSKSRACPAYKEYCSFLNSHPQTNNNNGGSSSSTTATTTLPFATAPTNLATICTVQHMQDNGPESCQEQCNGSAECCWKVGTVNCASSVPNQMCQAYTNACAVLNNLDSILPSDFVNGGGSTTTATTSSEELPFAPAPDDLSKNCNPSEMTGEISFHICQDRCDPAECCWSTKSSGCPASVPAEACQPYAEWCAILNDLTSYADLESNQQTAVSNTVPQAPSDLSTRCAKDNIIGAENGGEMLIECEKECLQVRHESNIHVMMEDEDFCLACANPLFVCGFCLWRTWICRMMSWFGAH